MMGPRNNSVRREEKEIYETRKDELTVLASVY